MIFSEASTGSPELVDFLSSSRSRLKRIILEELLSVVE
jgi:hypothetical protein